MANTCATVESSHSPSATESPAATKPKEQISSKRPAPLFIPSSKKRRVGIVRRTHSPKNVPSPLSSPVIVQHGTGCFDVHRVAPTVPGVAEGARLLVSGEILSVPTETTYYYCATIDLNSKKASNNQKQSSTETNNNGKKASSLSIASPLSCLFKNNHHHPQPKLLLQSPSEVDRILTFVPKAYMMQSSSSSSPSSPPPPVSFHEGRAVLHRLAARYWPGPLPMYLSLCSKSGLNDTCCCCSPDESEDRVKLPLEYMYEMPTKTDDSQEEERDCLFLGMHCPSHPLTGRVLNDVHEQSQDKVVAAVSAIVDEPQEYLTAAKDVCHHLITLPATRDHKILYVLNGEDKREAFVVPTCQYGQPSRVGLWIHSSRRTIYLIGSAAAPDACVKDLSSQQVQNALQHPTNSQDPKRKNRNRVISAVLRKWKVIDCRV